MALTVTLVGFLVVGLAAQIDAAHNKLRKVGPVVDNEVGDVKPMKKDFLGYSYAECVLVINNVLNMESASKNNISGVVSLKQKKSGQGPVYVNITMKGMDPDGSVQHGLHVHVYGDLTNGCNSAGGHFNPAGRKHGAPADAERHVGDWGNIERSANGTVDLMMTDNLASLAGGAHFIVGRSIVLHELTDDLGKGGDEGSLRTGNAGSRLACCVIGLTGNKEW